MIKSLIILLSLVNSIISIDRDLFPGAREKFGRNFDDVRRAGKTSEDFCWGYFDGHDGYLMFSSPNGDNQTSEALKKAYEIIYHPNLAPSEIHDKLKEWKKKQNPHVVSELKTQKKQLLEDHKKLLTKVYDIIQTLPTTFEKVMNALNRKQLSPRAALHEAYAYLQKIDKNVARSLLHIFDVLGCPLPADKLP